MPFKLTIQGKEGEAREGHYHQALVKIGRTEANEVHLSDSQRAVSSCHAEIYHKDQQYFLIDRSKNGTRMNGERLIQGKEYLLHAEDKIGIGEYFLTFSPTKEEDDLETTTYIAGGTLCEDIYHTLQGKLSQIYLERIKKERAGEVLPVGKISQEDVGVESDMGGEQEVALYLDALHDTLDMLNEEDQSKVLSLLEAAYPTEKATGEVSVPGGKTYARDETFSLAAKWGVELKDPGEHNDFMERLDRVMNLTIEFLMEAIKGRRQFQQEFDVESTRILSRKLNPLKLAGEGREIRGYLFNPATPIDEMGLHLKDTFRDMALHEMGMMAGLREALRGIMREMDPKTFLAKGQISPLSFLGLAKWFAWNAYEKRYNEMSHEEVKTFEKILGPSFKKGYIEIQKKKR